MPGRRDLTVALLAVVAVLAAALPAAATEVTTRRLGGADRYETAAVIARTGPAGGASASVARGDDFPDALAAVNLGGPVLLTPFADLPAASAQVLRDSSAGTAAVLGDTEVVSTRVEQQVRDLVPGTTRLPGRDRYATAARTYTAAYTFESRTPGLVDGLRTGLLTSGAAFADAMSAGPVAHAESLPLLLTAPDRLPGATREVLLYDGGSDLGLEQVVVVGGTSAVSDQVVREVEALGVAVRRVGGATRQETAVEVFRFAEQELGWTLSHVNLARGDDFADAVAGGPHAGRERAPILLTAGVEELGRATEGFLRSRSGAVSSLDVLGSEAAVSAAVLAQARSAASGGTTEWAVGEGFLTPEDAAAAERPGWGVLDAPAEPGPALDPCGARAFPEAEAVVASAERHMRSSREPGGSALTQEVFRYASPAAARTAFDEYVDQVEACPTRDVPEVPDHFQRFEVAELVAGERLLVRQPYCNPACTDLYVTYAMVARTGDGLTVAQYGIGLDGDPAEDARALLDALARRLATAVGA